MENPREIAGLLRLPIELRRLIILNVLKHGRREAPTLTPDVVAGRLRLRNAFDPNYPNDTNVYVEKCPKTGINGNSLLQTCRQLRQDTLDVIADTLETGKVKVPFIMDLMLIKGVGLLPTWMSFPYMPSHIEKLQIDVRIVRAEKELIPQDWICVSRYKREDYRHDENPTIWNLYIAFLFVAMGRLTTSPDDTLTAKRDWFRQMKLVEAAAEAQTRVSADSKPLAEPTDKAPAVLSATAHISSKGPYTVGEMYLNTHEFEYRANGDVITGPEPEPPWLEAQRNGNTLFGDYIFPPGPSFEYMSFDRQGQKALCQFCDRMPGAFSHLYAFHTSVWLQGRKTGQTLRIYLDVAATYIRMIRQVDYAEDQCHSTLLGAGPFTEWETILAAKAGGSSIVEARRVEMAQPAPDDDALHLLELAERRIDLGWWEEGVFKSGRKGS